MASTMITTVTGTTGIAAGTAGTTAATALRRRRLAGVGLMVAALGVFLLGAAAGRDGEPATTVPARPPAPRAAQATYVVQPGDTLWAVAEHLGGRRPLVDVVDDLVAANGGSAAIHVGQVLVLAG